MITEYRKSGKYVLYYHKDFSENYLTLTNEVKNKKYDGVFLAVESTNSYKLKDYI